MSHSCSALKCWLTAQGALDARLSGAIITASECCALLAALVIVLSMIGVNVSGLLLPAGFALAFAAKDLSHNFLAGSPPPDPLTSLVSDSLRFKPGACLPFCFTSAEARAVWSVRMSGDMTMWLGPLFCRVLLVRCATLQAGRPHLCQLLVARGGQFRQQECLV